MSDPANPAHRQVLSREAFIDRFGRVPDARAAGALLRANGGTDVEVAGDGLVAGALLRVDQAAAASSASPGRSGPTGRAPSSRPAARSTSRSTGVRDVRGAVVATTPRLADTRPSFTYFRGDWYEPSRFRSMTDAVANGGSGQRVVLVEDASDRFDLIDVRRVPGRRGAAARRRHRARHRTQLRVQERVGQLRARRPRPRGRARRRRDDHDGPAGRGDRRLRRRLLRRKRRHARARPRARSRSHGDRVSLRRRPGRRYDRIAVRPHAAPAARGAGARHPARRPGRRRRRVRLQGERRGARARVVAVRLTLRHLRGRIAAGRPRRRQRRGPLERSRPRRRRRHLGRAAAGVAGRAGRLPLLARLREEPHRPRRLRRRGRTPAGVLARLRPGRRRRNERERGARRRAARGDQQPHRSGAPAAHRRRPLRARALHAASVPRHLARERPRLERQHAAAAPRAAGEKLHRPAPSPPPLVRGCVEQQPDGCAVRPGFDAVTGIGSIKERAAVDALR